MNEPTFEMARNPAELDRPRFVMKRLGLGEPRAPEWIVKGVLPTESLSMVYGESGCGKSFLSLDLAASVATGRPFMAGSDITLPEAPSAERKSIWDGAAVETYPGHAVKNPGGVFYICAEGQAGLENRLCAWKKHHGVDLKDAPLFTNETPLNLIQDGAAGVVAAVRALAAEAGKPMLIILDTWSRTLGGDDSAPQDAAAGIQAADTIRAELPGITVLLIHHVGLTEKNRARGWGGVFAVCDTVFQLDAGPDGARVLTCMKQKEGPLTPPEAMKPVVVGLGIYDDEGAEVTSMVFEPCRYTPLESGEKQKPLGTNQKNLLRIYRDLAGEYPDGVPENILRERFTEATGASRCGWFNASKSLQERGLLTLEGGLYHAKEVRLESV
jgi:RecA/RadA recombinase